MCISVFAYKVGAAYAFLLREWHTYIEVFLLLLRNNEKFN